MTKNEGKKILILSSGYYPNLVAGAEVAVREITDRIRPQDCEFDMLTLRFDSRLPRFERIGNVNVYRLGFTKNNPSSSDLVKFPLYLNKVLFPVLATLKFRKLDSKRHYDGLWAMMTYMGMTAVLIRTFARKIKFVFTIQDGDNFNDILGRKRILPFVFLIKRAFRDAEIVQVISNYLADWARKMGGKNVLVVPNGVDLTRFIAKDGPKSINKVSGKFGFPEDSKIIITTSRLVYKNAVDVLIKALVYLPSEVKLVIAGVGSEEATLRQIVLNNNLSSRVKFLGFVSQDELPSVVSSADVFSRPSRSEGQGISFIEAMALRVPVVATLEGGIADFLLDKKTGLSVATDDPEDLARKINILIRDEEVRRVIVDGAEKMVKEKYDWNNLVIEMREKVFSNI